MNTPALTPLPELPELGAGFPEKMALVDIETTGGKATRDAITEIAVIIIEQGKVLGYWQTLVNPGVSIPPFITRLTGITNAMVKIAPTFAEVASSLTQLLQGRTFVAHNARFDYGFIKQALLRSGISYSTRPLCSVKLSRALFPGFRSHGMDALIKRFNLVLPSRHRALGDCIGIAKFFAATAKLINNQDIHAACAEITQNAVLPTQLPKSRINKLPNGPGVYYFHDKDGMLLYIGKSVALKKRVMSHFYQDHQNPKDLEMSRLIADISYTATASDFSAQLLESQEIKKHSPPFNRRLKKHNKLYQFALNADDNGYMCLSIAQSKSQHESNSFGLFRSKRQAQDTLRKLADDYYLCHQLLGLESASGRVCFRAQLKRCFGPCAQKEPSHLYNDRLYQALEAYRVKTWPYPSAIVIKENIQHGPANNDTDTATPAYHLIDQWRYLGTVADEAELADKGYTVSTHGTTVTKEALTEEGDLYENCESKTPFDLDTYRILARFILDSSQQVRCNLTILPCIAIDG